MCQMVLFSIFFFFFLPFLPVLFQGMIIFLHAELSSNLGLTTTALPTQAVSCLEVTLLFKTLCGLLQANFSVLLCFWPAIQLNLAGERSVFSQLYANLCHVHSNLSWNISSLLLPNSPLLPLVIIIRVTNVLPLFLSSLLSSQPYSMGNLSEGE